MNCWQQIDQMKAQHEADVLEGKAAAKGHHFVRLKCHPHTGRWSCRLAAGWQGGATYLNAGTVKELVAAMAEQAPLHKREPRARKPKPEAKAAA